MELGKIECVLGRVMREKNVTDIQLANGTGLPLVKIIRYKSIAYKHKYPEDFMDMAKIATFLGVPVEQIWRFKGI